MKLSFNFFNQRKSAFCFFLVEIVFIVIALFAVTPVHAQQITYPVTHPFMIVKPSQYPELRSRANLEPWKGMQERAIQDCAPDIHPAQFITSNDAWNTTKYTRKMKDIVSACALSYILDSTNKDNYRIKAVETLQKWDELQSRSLIFGFSIFGPNVGSAFMNSVLALDIMYDDIQADDIANGTDNLGQIEGKLQYTYDDMFGVDAPHLDTRFLYSWEEPAGPGEKIINGTKITKLPGPILPAIWNMYHLPEASSQTDFNTRMASIQTNAVDYKVRVLSMFTDDGVFREGGGYGVARYSGDRDFIQNFMDIVQFTGIDTSYYYNPNNPNNPTNLKMRNFFEWVYGYSMSPFSTYVTFGDAAIYDGLYWYQRERNAASPMLRVHKFYPPGSTPDAAGYAVWRHRDPGIPYPGLTAAWTWSYPGRLFNYVLADQPLPAPKTPPSKIFPDGGAFFWEENANDNSLMGALWNVASDTTDTRNWHSHRDVNAVVIYGYGEPILVNAGYKSSNSQLAYTHDSSNSNNTIWVDQTNHQKYLGAGITEGITSADFDYASGDSGTALPNGHHQRNYVFVHPQDGKNGYFVLFDEISTTAGNSTDMILHPASESVTAITNLQEYHAAIKQNPHFTDTDPNRQTPDARSPDYSLIDNPPFDPANQVGLSIFYGTLPNSVNVQDGFVADWDFSFTGKALYAGYTFLPNKTRNIVTVLFPTDNTHTKSTMSRITGANYSGVAIDHAGGVMDTALESSDISPIINGQVTFNGKASWYRTVNNQVSAYFVRQGIQFQSGQKGFSSQQAVSLYLKETAGKIVSPGTEVTFTYPGITGVKLNGQTITPISMGTNTATVTIPAGAHDIELLSSSVSPTPTPKPGDTNNDGSVNILDLSTLLSNFGLTVPANTSGDVDGNGLVNLSDLAVVLANFGS